LADGSFYRVLLPHHTPELAERPRLRRRRRAPLLTGLALSLLAAGSRARAQGVTVDALSVTMVGAPGRGALRLRADVQTTPGWVASGVMVRPGRRTTAELHTDTLGTLRNYSSETRDSAGTIVDRVQVRSAGGRITLERTTPQRRQVREYPATPGLLITDGEAIVPLLILVARGSTPGALRLLDVRGLTLSTVTVARSSDARVMIADSPIATTSWTISGSTAVAAWWADERGRLVSALLAPGVRVQRDDPPL
jgi:hypothetical protein